MYRSKGHKRLTEDDADEKDKVIAGVSYIVNYLGSSEILDGDGKGKGRMDAAVSEIYSRYGNKAKLKSLTRRKLFVSANCVSLVEPSQNAVQFKYSTVKITFCNTSEKYPNAFAFVVKESLHLPFVAHVLHCANPAQAAEVCTAMSQAFDVRSALYHAKRIDKAGWTTGLLLSQQKIDQCVSVRQEDRANLNGEVRASDIIKNDFVSADDTADQNNNAFGDFACAVASTPLNDGEQTDDCTVNGVCRVNGWSSCGNKENAEVRHDCVENKENHGGNRINLSLAKVLLSRNSDRQRSNNTPLNLSKLNPWPQNGQIALSGELTRVATMETNDDEDEFSMLARERSGSNGQLTKVISV